MMFAFHKIFYSKDVTFIIFKLLCKLDGKKEVFSCPKNEVFSAFYPCSS